MNTKTILTPTGQQIFPTKIFKSSRNYQKQQILNDIDNFRIKMERLSDSIRSWLRGSELRLCIRQINPCDPTVQEYSYTISSLVLSNGSKYAALTPRSLYFYRKGTGSLKGEVHLTIDIPRTHPRTTKYVLCLAEPGRTGAEWMFYSSDTQNSPFYTFTKDNFLDVISSMNPFVRPDLYGK